MLWIFGYVSGCLNPEMMSLLCFMPGETGLATRMKLVVSMLVGTTLAGLSESLALSTKLGLNITDVLEVLRHSSANSQFIREKGAGECLSMCLTASY